MHKLLGLLLAGVILSCGCSRREPTFVGSWRIDTSSFPAGLTAEQASKINALLPKMTLQFNANKTYRFVMTSSARTTEFAGTYKLNGQTATMTTTSINGVDSKSMVEGTSSDIAPPHQGPISAWQAELSADSKKLSLSFMGTETTFVRAA